VEILKPGGSIFITTENRTVASWLFVIVAAEYIFKKITVGTHDWNKFITPHEVQHILDGCKFSPLLSNENYQNIMKKIFYFIKISV